MDQDKNVRIIVADDHAVVRMGIKFSVAAREDLYVQDEASTFAELCTCLARNTYDLLILDLNLGDKNGMFTVRETSDRFPDLPILVLSMFPDDPYALQSIQAGASGYLNKKMVATDLLNAIDSIVQDQTYLSPSFRDTLPYGTPLQKTPGNILEKLSRREYEVYTLVASGMTFKEIAEALKLSPKTISTYLTRILEKLDLSNTNQLIQYALQESLGT